MLKEFCKIVDAGQFVVLDTETTGLKAGEICQIAIVSSGGDRLVDSLVKTRNPIPASATAIHGITDEMVKDAPTFLDLCPTLFGWLSNTHIIAYNVDYDRRMMYQSVGAWQKDIMPWRNIGKWQCAMLAFAEFYGEWSPYKHDYTWKSLAVACDKFKIRQVDNHTALGDALMTRKVCYAMSSAYPFMEK
jgi:DNA polymerase III subunit epsilon